MLKAHRVKQEERRIKVGEAWEGRDLVFPDLTGGYLNPIHVLRMFWKILEQAGLPHMHFHDLRHSSATMLLLSMGVHPKIVQERLGHHDIGTTMDIYSHVLPSMQEGAMKQMDSLLGEQSKDS